MDVQRALFDGGAGVAVPPGPAGDELLRRAGVYLTGRPRTFEEIRVWRNHRAALAAAGAPLGPYTLGVQVGVPAGTVLTATSGLPAADAVEDLTVTHPITEEVAVLEDVSVWRRRSWTSTMAATPPSGGTYLFDQCSFQNSLDNMCVDIIDTNFTPDPMLPLAVFRDCQFDGDDSTGRALNAGCVWLIRCHLTGTEDAWGGGYYSVAIGSNFIPTTDGGVDPHQDGIQCAGIGELAMYRCYASAGTDPEANSAVRLGTDFSAITNVYLRECTLDRGGYSLQVRGDAGSRGVTNVTVENCRWTGSAPKGFAGFGPTDFEQVTGVTWVGNQFLGDGAVIASPV